MPFVFLFYSKAISDNNFNLRHTVSDISKNNSSKEIALFLVIQLFNSNYKDISHGKDVKINIHKTFRTKSNEYS